MFPNINDLVTKLDGALKAICGHLVELVGGQKNSNADLRKIAHALIAEYGFFTPDAENGILPRSVLQPPMVWEGSTTTQAAVETKHPQGKRAIYGGYYANIGDNPFRVRLICPGGESPEHTLPPGVSIPLTSVVNQVVILAVDGQEAKYQVYGR